MPRWIEDYRFPLGGSCARPLSLAILVLGRGLAKPLSGGMVDCNVARVARHCFRPVGPYKIMLGHIV